MSYFSMNPFGSSSKKEDEPESGRRKSVLETLHDKAHKEGFSDDEGEGHTEIHDDEEEPKEVGGEVIAPLRPWWTCLVPCAKP